MLMMKLAAALLACQFTVSVEMPEFTVSVDDSPKTETPVPAPSDAPVKRSPYLAMFTAHYCGPCQTWKKHVKPQVEAAGYTVVAYEMTLPRYSRKWARKISRYPSFAVIDYDTGEWLSDVTVGTIDLATAKRMLDRSEKKAHEAAPVSQTLAPPSRYIQWPGWGTIDLETYNRNCNCSMCVSIRAMQRQYLRDLESFQSQSAVTPDQEGCPHELVEKMLDQMQLRSDDVLADLGCGDGRILIAAARRGIRGIGIEIDPDRAAVATRAVKAAGVSHLVTIETGDALEFDTQRATAVTAYLYPPLLEKLSVKLRGKRVVASPYHEIPGLAMVQYGDLWLYRESVTQ